MESVVSLYVFNILHTCTKKHKRVRENIAIFLYLKSRSF